MSLSITLKVGKRKTSEAVLPADAPEHTPAPPVTALVPASFPASFPAPAPAPAPALVPHPEQWSLRSYAFKRPKPAVPADKQPAPLKNLKAILAAEGFSAPPHYQSIAAPPNLVPPKKCVVS
jgi:hypothetical protein